jgi:mannose-6-phosphate isomerase-like protein (cupin superfamily)
MTGYAGPIESHTLKNTYFRQVLFTGKHAQLVVMCLQPGEEIGKEVHPDVDQFFRIEQGEARFVFNETEEHLVRDADAVVVPAGTTHNVINASKTTPLNLYTIYSPPNHPDGTVHKTKSEGGGGRSGRASSLNTTGSKGQHGETTYPGRDRPRIRGGDRFGGV